MKLKIKKNLKNNKINISRISRKRLEETIDKTNKKIKRALKKVGEKIEKELKKEKKLMKKSAKKLKTLTPRIKKSLIKYFSTASQQIDNLEKFFYEFKNIVKENLKSRKIYVNFNANVNNKVSVIIPAYNEEKRILNVVKPALKLGIVEEVIIVDDGSKDKTSEVVTSYMKKLSEKNKKRLKLIRHKKNKGKAKAMETGVKKAKSKYILFLDADLRNLKSEDIKKLCLPVLLNKVDMTLSLRQNSLEIFKLWGCDFISGERCLNKEILKGIWKKIKKGFGIEVEINKRILDRKLRFATVTINAKNTEKMKKRGIKEGIMGDLAMINEMLEQVSPVTILFQFISMSLLQYKIIFIKRKNSQHTK